MPFHVIVACTHEGGIGLHRAMPWHIPEDLRYFAEVTAGSVVVMGRKTWESLPESRRPLPGRENIVISQTLTASDGQYKICRSLPEALATAAREHPERTVFVIGGAALYREAIVHPECKKIYVTLIYNDIPCDTFFPMDTVFSGETFKAVVNGRCRFSGDIMYSWHEYHKKA